MRAYFLIFLFMSLLAKPLFADDNAEYSPQEYPAPENPNPGNYPDPNTQQGYPPEYNQSQSPDTGDIVMDYRSLIQKIDEMRLHEEEVLRKLEDLSRSYEDGLAKMEETQKKLEDEIQDLKDWHEKEAERLEKISGGSGPVEIKGEVRGAPNDRYTSSY